MNHSIAAYVPHLTFLKRQRRSLYCHILLRTWEAAFTTFAECLWGKTERVITLSRHSFKITLLLFCFIWLHKMSGVRGTYRGFRVMELSQPDLCSYRVCVTHVQTHPYWAAKYCKTSWRKTKKNMGHLTEQNVTNLVQPQHTGSHYTYIWIMWTQGYDMGELWLMTEFLIIIIIDSIHRCAHIFRAYILFLVSYCWWVSENRNKQMGVSPI